jgi:hypothetical protein
LPSSSSGRHQTWKNDVAGQLTLTIDSVEKSGVGAVTIVDLTVTNPSYMEIMDPTVTCTSYAPNATEIDHKGKTLYGILKGKRRFRVNLSILHSQPHSTSCGVTDFDLTL